jgi:galactokinase
VTTLPRRAFRAPGRVNLIGDHTDYSGGLVLPAAIDRSITVEVSPAPSRIVLDSDRHGRADVAADGSAPPARGWGRFVSAVAAELADLGREPGGMTGTVHSDLPDGSGLSSSAALTVAVGLALGALSDLELSPLALAAVAQRAETRAVGVPVGIMDQAVSLLGRAGHAILLDCGTLAHKPVPLPPTLSIVVIDSGVPRQLEGSGYAQRRAELESGLGALGERRPADVDPDELPVLLAGLDDLRRRRVRHVVTENARVRRAERALTAHGGPDLRALGEIFAASHASLRDDFEVSVPAVDRLVEMAVDAGAVGARMTGGGFGGAIVALVLVDEVEAVGDAVVEGYARTGGTATVVPCRAADGAAEVSPAG